MDFVGSGGTDAGTIRALRDLSPRLKSFLAELEGAWVLGRGCFDNPANPMNGHGHSMTDLSAPVGVTVDGLGTHYCPP